jgi:E3 ubiquitin-protein ligase HUWE1
MTNAIKDQIGAFTEGFNDIVPHDVLAILNPSELELLISGTPEIDIEDLRAQTEYTGYTPASPQVRWFWDVVRDLNDEDRARLLMFCTGTSKVPLDGFKALQGISGPRVRVSVSASQVGRRGATRVEDAFGDGVLTLERVGRDIS